MAPDEGYLRIRRKITEFYAAFAQSLEAIWTKGTNKVLHEFLTNVLVKRIRAALFMEIVPPLDYVERMAKIQNNINNFLFL
jgi:hypothetical protein